MLTISRRERETIISAYRGNDYCDISHVYFIVSRYIKNERREMHKYLFHFINEIYQVHQFADTEKKNERNKIM
jgi:hypothetical protein